MEVSFFDCPYIERCSSCLFFFFFFCWILEQCAGNRRTAMSKVKSVRGVGWDVSAIGNGTLTVN